MGHRDRPVGYVLNDFPQLSETFIENELRALEQLGTDVVAFSLYRPDPTLAGETHLDPTRLHYRPRGTALAFHFLSWAVRRPIVTAKHLLRAVRLRSETFLRGALSAGWVATQMRRAGVRHVHAHFALDAACTAVVAADLLGVPATYTLHAHEIYMRNRTLCTRLAMADKVVTVCQYNVEQLRERCPTAAAQTFEIVYCGVDVTAFTPGPRIERTGPLRLLSVGRLVEMKGFDDLIDAVALLRDRGRSVVCEIVGHGPLRDALQRQIHERRLDDEVTLSGPLPPAAVAERMAEVDLFVLACRVDGDGNRDSMPVVIKEAMACRLPVVATDAVAVPEMVDDEVGRLAAPYDPHSLADAIEEICMLEPQARWAMGDRARRRVEERFNVVSETQKLVRLFDQLGAMRGR
jgi:glycosyltransferase involved in cell wall biosynthesis